MGRDTKWCWLGTAVACRYLLPPVIFYCGLSVEKSRFFIALPSILMYGVFGTLASFIIISVFMYLTLGFAMFKMEVGLESKWMATAAGAAS
jgi:NhaP-type Na+/H+ or K+/H+ antiporter